MDIIIAYHKWNMEIDSHRILECVATDLFGSSNYEVGKMINGKPYFKYHPEIYFSISHSGDYWACAFSDEEIGMDLQLEENHHNKEKIAKRFFGEEEQEYLEQNDYREFYDFWAMKEAYVKYTGEGLARGLTSIQLVKDNEILSKIEKPSNPEKFGYLQKIDFQLGYSMWICTKSIKGSKLIRKKELI